MGNKTYLLFLLFLISCGPEVKISNEKLEYQSGLSQGKSTATNQEGLLVRGSRDRVVVNETSYFVSVYSSHLALEFIAAKPLNKQYPVKFRGKFKNNEIILEKIELNLKGPS